MYSNSCSARRGLSEIQLSSRSSGISSFSDGLWNVLTLEQIERAVPLVGFDQRSKQAGPNCPWHHGWPVSWRCTLSEFVTGHLK